MWTGERVRHHEGGDVNVSACRVEKNEAVIREERHGRQDSSAGDRVDVHEEGDVDALACRIVREARRGQQGKSAGKRVADCGEGEVNASACREKNNEALIARETQHGRRERLAGEQAGDRPTEEPYGSTCHVVNTEADFDREMRHGRQRGMDSLTGIAEARLDNMSVCTTPSGKGSLSGFRAAEELEAPGVCGRGVPGGTDHAGLGDSTGEAGSSEAAGGLVAPGVGGSGVPGGSDKAGLGGPTGEAGSSEAPRGLVAPGVGGSGGVPGGNDQAGLGDSTGDASSAETVVSMGVKRRVNSSGGSTGQVKVTNLSSKNLSPDQLSLLCKGLGFVPVRKQQITHLLSELKEWERLVRLKEYWSNSPQAQTTDDTLTDRDLKYKKTHWTPDKGREPWLDLYVEEVIRSVMDGLRKNVGSNLSKGEEDAILELLKDEEIIIRPADKGSGIVVMNTSDYFDGLRKEVNDPSTYRPTESDQTPLVHKKVKILADKLLRKGYIGKHLHKYLIPTRPKPGYMQGNPKLHKEGHPLRVIVSGRGHATEGMAELAEQELNAHVEGQQSFVKDTTDFINKIKDVKLPMTSEIQPLLFCMDVRKLYPSVPRGEGIEACKEALDLRPGPSIPTSEIIEMIELVLDNNNFSVGTSSHFTQINGTAIGSKLGRNYACTYLGKWEAKLFSSSSLQPYMYLRYIDDIFGIWLHGEDKLKEFHSLANAIHEQIKLDLRISSTEIEFLDVKVSVEDDGLKTDVYAKPTDSKAYLHFSSDHPSHMKKAIPLGLAMRAKRICSSDPDFINQTEDICKNLSERQYPEALVNQGLNRVKHMKRKDVLRGAETSDKNYSVKKQRKGVPLVVTYSSHLPNISKILKEKKTILSRSEKLREIFKDDVYVSYRRGTNLKDVLVHGKTKRLVKTDAQSQGNCGKNCVICKVMYRQKDRITGPGGETKTTCTYDKTIGCKSRNVVYGVFCEVCDCIVYVGETGGILYQRVQNHLSTIRCGRTEMEVAAHFSGAGHSLSSAKFVGLEKVWRAWVTYRRVREQRWVNLLGTHRNNGGLNKKTA